jgi:hypothetical protein
VQREARELESRVDVLDEALSEVEGKAQPIPYHRRWALPPTPATSTVTQATATASAAAVKAPEATRTLGSLATTAAHTATQPTFSSRMEVELVRPQDPDRDLERQIDQLLGGVREAGGSGRRDSAGSSHSQQTPPRGDSDDDHVATPQSVKVKRTRTKRK